MSESPLTRRRWLRFSLRTMFVVATVFAVWLGWELKYIRDRQKMLEALDHLGGFATTPTELIEDVRPPKILASVPFWRRWLGDEAIQGFVFPDRIDNLHKENPRQEELEAYRAMFPEVAEIGFVYSAK